MHLTQQRLSFLGTLPNDSAGTHSTLMLMRSLVQRFKRDSRIRETAIALVSHAKQRDWTREAAAIYQYVRDSIRYVRDISGVETLQTPLVTMELEAGDCDDKSTLLAALLESIGHPTRFVATGYQAAGRYSHVYLETKIGDRWVPMDPTTDKPFGWQPRVPVTRMMVFN